MQTMNTLKPTQSHVEPLIASIKSFKITSSSNPSKYPQVINCELVVENWLRIDAESSNPINNCHISVVERSLSGVAAV